MNKYEKAIVRLSKIAKKECSKIRPMMAGGYIQDFYNSHENKLTLISNGMWCFIGYKDYSELKDFCAVDTTLGDYPNLMSLCTDNINDKTKLDWFNEEDKIVGDKYNDDIELIKLGADYYNLKYVKIVSESLENCELYYCDNNFIRENKLLMLKGTNGYGFICPYRYEEKDNNDI